MHKKRKPHEERESEDYMEAADNALELAKVLAGQGGLYFPRKPNNQAAKSSNWMTRS